MQARRTAVYSGLRWCFFIAHRTAAMSITKQPAADGLARRRCRTVRVRHEQSRQIRVPCQELKTWRAVPSRSLGRVASRRAFSHSRRRVKFAAAEEGGMWLRLYTSLPFGVGNEVAHATARALTSRACPTSVASRGAKSGCYSLLSYDEIAPHYRHSRLN